MNSDSLGSSGFVNSPACWITPAMVASSGRSATM